MTVERLPPLWGFGVHVHLTRGFALLHPCLLAPWPFMPMDELTTCRPSGPRHRTKKPWAFNHSNWCSRPLRRSPLTRRPDRMDQVTSPFIFCAS